MSLRKVKTLYYFVVTFNLFELLLECLHKAAGQMPKTEKLALVTSYYL